MKKIEKLIEGRNLIASKGNPKHHNFQQVVVSGFYRGDNFVFQVETTNQDGRSKLQTIDKNEVLVTMQAFTPAKNWKLAKKDVK